MQVRAYFQVVCLVDVNDCGSINSLSSISYAPTHPSHYRHLPLVTTAAFTRGCCCAYINGMYIYHQVTSVVLEDAWPLPVSLDGTSTGGSGAGGTTGWPQGTPRKLFGLDDGGGGGSTTSQGLDEDNQVRVCVHPLLHRVLVVKSSLSRSHTTSHTTSLSLSLSCNFIPLPLLCIHLGSRASIKATGRSSATGEEAENDQARRLSSAGPVERWRCHCGSGMLRR